MREKYVTRVEVVDAEEIIYPDSDGKPMADNTLQFAWIQTLQANIDQMYGPDEAFVAGDLLWYPVKGSPRICTAPDVLVALGRPKGYRGSYKQWEEAGIAPQFVIEVLSQNNTAREMLDKLFFYEQYGVQEYVFLDPYKHEFFLMVRQGERLQLLPEDERGEVRSPLTGIVFAYAGEEIAVRYPDGRPFKAFAELAKENRHLEQLAEEAQAQAEAERASKEAALEELARLRAELEKLREG